MRYDKKNEMLCVLCGTALYDSYIRTRWRSKAEHKQELAQKFAEREYI